MPGRAPSAAAHAHAGSPTHLHLPECGHVCGVTAPLLQACQAHLQGRVRMGRRAHGGLKQGWQAGRGGVKQVLRGAARDGCSCRRGGVNTAHPADGLPINLP